jgi:hypothetical protein
MNRLKVVEKIIEWLDDADIFHKIEFAKIIYEKYPNCVSDKGTGLNVNIHTIPTEFLIMLLKKNESQNNSLEFWQTLF